MLRHDFHAGLPDRQNRRQAEFGTAKPAELRLKIASKQGFGQNT